MKTTYRKKKYLPLSLAREYLLNDFRAIKKISKFFVDYDDFPVIINGKENVNDEIKLEGFADVHESYISTLLAEINKAECSPFCIEMIFDDRDEDHLIYPDDTDFDLPELFTFKGEINQSTVYVLRKEVIKIARRWNLACLNSVLDTPFPEDEDTENGGTGVENKEGGGINTKKIAMLLEKNRDDAQDESTEEKEDGRKSTHLKNKIELLEGAFLASLYFYDEFFGGGDKLTAKGISKTLFLHSTALWPERAEKYPEDENNHMPIPNAAERHLSALLKKMEGHNLRKSSKLSK